MQMRGVECIILVKCLMRHEPQGPRCLQIRRVGLAIERDETDAAGRLDLHLTTGAAEDAHPGFSGTLHRGS